MHCFCAAFARLPSVSHSCSIALRPSRKLERKLMSRVILRDYIELLGSRDGRDDLVSICLIARELGSRLRDDWYQ